MKKIILLFITIVTLFSLTSCGYNVSTKNKAKIDDVEDFFKGKKLPFEDGNASFVYTIKNKTSYKSNDRKVSVSYTYDIYGTLENNLVGSFAYDAKINKKYVVPTLDGKEKSVYKTVEEGKVFLKKDSSENKMFFTVKNKTKISDAKINIKTLKTTFHEETSAYSLIKGELSQMYLFISSNNTYNSSYFYYIDGEKIKIVNSDEEYHTEIVMVFENDVLVKYHYEYKNSVSQTEKELIFKNVKEINYPKNTDKYRK